MARGLLGKPSCFFDDIASNHPELAAAQRHIVVTLAGDDKVSWICQGMSVRERKVRAFLPRDLTWVEFPIRIADSDEIMWCGALIAESQILGVTEWRLKLFSRSTQQKNERRYNVVGNLGFRFGPDKRGWDWFWQNTKNVPITIEEQKETIRPIFVSLVWIFAALNSSVCQPREVDRSKIDAKRRSRGKSGATSYLEIDFTRAERLGCSEQDKADIESGIRQRWHVRDAYVNRYWTTNNETGERELVAKRIESHERGDATLGVVPQKTKRVK